MSDQPKPCKLRRRGVIATIGAAGIALAKSTTRSVAQEAGLQAQICPAQYLDVPTMKAQAAQREGEWLETAGFHSPGDGGGALYQLRQPGEGLH